MIVPFAFAAAAAVLLAAAFVLALAYAVAGCCVTLFEGEAVGIAWAGGCLAIAVVAGIWCWQLSSELVAAPLQGIALERTP